MEYCEHCLSLIEAMDGNECPYCGYNFIREVKEDDYCHLISKPDMWKEIIEGILEKNAIPYRTKNDKLIKEDIVTYDYYVQYKYYEQAYKVINEVVNID